MSSSSDDEDDSISGQMDDGQPTTDTSTSKVSSSSGSDKKVKFVQKESQYVFFLRVGVLMVLLLAAAAVSVMVWFITTNGETASFQLQYNSSAQKVLETFMSIATDSMGSAGSLIVAIVAQGRDNGNRSWPFVTLSAFQERAVTIMKLSDALYIGMNPVVTRSQRAEWEMYTNTNYSDDAGWYQEGRHYQQILSFDELDDRVQVQTDDPNLNLCCGIANVIYDFDKTETRKAEIAANADFYLPVWQTSPVTKSTVVNENYASNSEGAKACLNTSQVVLEGMQRSEPGYADSANPVTAEIAWLLSMAYRERTEYIGDIFTNVYFPLFNAFFGEREAVGLMRIVIHWASYFRGVMPDSVRGIVFVLENSCDHPFTYKIDGAVVTPLGEGDLHDTNFDSYVRTATFRDVDGIADGTADGMKLHQNKCPFSIRVYPSVEFYNDYNTNMPLSITCAVACVFIFTVFMFFVYDRLVERRQRILMQKAQQTHKIVSSLFPKTIRDRLLEDVDAKVSSKKSGLITQNHRLKTFLSGNEENGGINQAPIADLFPHATVMFADISGFTAWSSSREPSQVFSLLQSVYQAFDHIAKRRKVFKVETIGDSYVAVTGVPEPQANHAVIMARFAAECLFKMAEVVRDLESSLGPDTAELSMRFGMNSGPVTAGVLRGERSRFQLFGDTMNTASRMESTGIPGKIQASQSTADLLIKAGKQHWVTTREANVLAEGKGVLQTFWITPYAKKGTSNASSETGSNSEKMSNALASQNMDSKANAVLKHERHIDWMVELLEDSIRLIVAKHQVQNRASKGLILPQRRENEIALDEVVEAIKLPSFDAKNFSADLISVEISEEISADLREYVSIIASAYQDNPFHNFEHACHVTMSVSKFLKRIVTTEFGMDQLDKSKDDNKLAKKIASHLHDYTHGINSDPVTQFAIVFSALIHDVDHRGVSNVQLMKEEPHMAKMFREKSLAEQNSLDIAWNLLLSERFRGLLSYIFVDTEELMRFRQVIVNVVLATDIFDEEMNDIRKLRWEKAFNETSCALSKEANAMRATIVMEHIMQASDVCHTMQHWHIYRKGNERLFRELTIAFKAGRMGADPETFWYQGELGFFDNHIIPLARKLKDCNVFGVSSDECLNNALMNRAEWEVRGQEFVADMVERIKLEE